MYSCEGSNVGRTAVLGEAVHGRDGGYKSMHKQMARSSINDACVFSLATTTTS